MMYTSFSLAFITLASFALAADVCSSVLAGQVSCLKSNTDASSHCTSILQKYSGQTSTTTVTVTKTDAVVTVTSTAIESLYITEGGTATSYSSLVTATTSQETLTTYLSDASVAKRAASTCDVSSALSQLSTLQSAGLSSACSCLGAVPTATTLATKAIVTATATAGASTVTTTITGQVKFTVSATTVIPYTVTSSSTHTSTVSLAAPTFTKVWGPGSGCLDNVPSTFDSLNTSFTQAEAVMECQDRCAQIPSCAFVYVQWSFDGYQVGIDPFYRCFYNDHALDASTDLVCGEQTDIWGSATGYNAIGRGT